MKRLVLTGGPCAGKTTAKNYLYEKLSDYGFNAILVPEAATFLITAGLDPRNFRNKKQILEFEELLLKTQMRFEDELFAKALKIKNGRRKVMLCDRGCMDVAAYIDRKGFDKILRRNRWTRVGLRDRRYDSVFHLITAAEGREEHYNNDNAARLETPAEARLADLLTRNAWLGHPHLTIIDNSTLFDGKLRRLLNAIRKALGIPVAIETERKFLINNTVDISRIPVPFQEIQIEQVYLTPSKRGRMRLRRRSQKNSGVAYYQTLKMPTGSAMSRIEIEKQIRGEEYYRRLKDQDPNFAAIRKKRVCFLWQNQYFELDVFTDPKWVCGLTLLEIELTKENDKVSIPSWLGKVKEVTEDPAYKNSNLAKEPA